MAADPAAKGKEIIARAPFDRITLLDNTTWEIEPLSPRPLPVYDPAKKPPKRKAQLPHNGNIGMVGQKSSLEEPKVPEDDEEDVLLIHMLAGDVRDYKVRREHIRAIAYFEDMLIEEANRLTSAGRFGKAFEHLLMAQSRSGKWAGLDDAVDRVLFAEGSQALLDNDGERGLRLLGELYRRNPKYPELGDKLANSYLVRIKRAFDVGAYAAGRQVLRELESLAPENAAVREGRNYYEGRARAFFDRASKAEGVARLDLLRSAAEVWPSLDGLESAYREAFAATPTLDVAVAELHEPVGPWINSAASARTSALLYRPILASTTEEGLKGSIPGQLAASVETFDLSRGLRIKVRPGFRWNDGSRPVAALDVARMLVDRAVPTIPGYSARWADLLDRVDTTEEEQVEVRLSRPSLHPERWLVAPVGPAHGGGDGWVSTAERGRVPVGDGAYRWMPAEKGVSQYVADRRPDAPPVRRVREVRYDSPASALAAFARGEVSLIESVAPDRMAEVGAMEGVKVGSYATPSLHRVALDGRNEALRNRTLRRALSLAIDRKVLLEETILRRRAGGADVVADGPFLKGTYADAPDVAPLPYDPWLGGGLVAARAEGELGGGTIKLTFEYSAHGDRPRRLPADGPGVERGRRRGHGEGGARAGAGGEAPIGREVRPRLSREPPRRAGLRRRPDDLPRLRRATLDRPARVARQPAHPPVAPRPGPRARDDRGAGSAAPDRPRVARRVADAPALAGRRPLRLAVAHRGDRRRDDASLPRNRVVEGRAVVSVRSSLIVGLLTSRSVALPRPGAWQEPPARARCPRPSDRGEAVQDPRVRLVRPRDADRRAGPRPCGRRVARAGPPDGRAGVAGRGRRVGRGGVGLRPGIVKAGRREAAEPGGG